MENYLFKFGVSHNKSYRNVSHTNVSDYRDIGDMGIYKVEYPLRGFKKVNCRDESGRISTAIVELEIPVDALIVNSNRNYRAGDKLRASEARVKNIKTDLVLDNPIYFSSLDRSFYYNPRDTVVPVDGLSLDSSEICADGIHFFEREYSAYFY